MDRRYGERRATKCRFLSPEPLSFRPVEVPGGSGECGPVGAGGVRGSREEVSNWRLEISGRSDRFPGGDQSSRCRGEIHQPLVHLADGR